MKACQTACLWFLLLFFTINVAVIEGESLLGIVQYEKESEEQRDVLHAFQSQNNTNSNVSLEDNVLPLVLIVEYFWDEADLTNITFIAEIVENGSGVAEVILYYYFRPINGENGRSNFENATMSHLDGTLWRADVPFNPDSSVEILYRVSVTDNAGNINSNAFPAGLDPTGRKYYEYSKTGTRSFSGFTMTLLLVSGIAILLFRKHSRRRSHGAK